MLVYSTSPSTENYSKCFIIFILNPISEKSASLCQLPAGSELHKVCSDCVILWLKKRSITVTADRKCAKGSVRATEISFWDACYHLDPHLLKIGALSHIVISATRQNDEEINFRKDSEWIGRKNSTKTVHSHGRPELICIKLKGTKCDCILIRNRFQAHMLWSRPGAKNTSTSVQTKIRGKNEMTLKDEKKKHTKKKLLPFIINYFKVLAFLFRTLDLTWNEGRGEKKKKTI